MGAGARRHRKLRRTRPMQLQPKTTPDADQTTGSTAAPPLSLPGSQRTARASEDTSDYKATAASPPSPAADIGNCSAHWSTPLPAPLPRLQTPPPHQPRPPQLTLP